VDERLHKLLAQHGIGSRREVEAWIREGRVLVNGRPAEIGQKVAPGDRIAVDGRDVTRRLATNKALQVLVYHKPSGEMSRGGRGDERAGVEERLPGLRSGRWVAVNALGYGEDGLLLLTNDGALAAAAGRRGRDWPVEYRVRALQPRGAGDWPELPRQVIAGKEVIDLEAAEMAGQGASNAWFRIACARSIPRGGVRALFDAAGLKVNRVMLVRWGPFALPRDLPRGRHRELTQAELEPLLELTGRARESSASRATGRRKAPSRGRRRPTGR
jgi:23S rRNA pseudouridine2605 synthase